MLNELIHDLQRDIGDGLRAIVIYGLAIIALIAAVVLASAAGYTVIADLFGPVTAQLVLAGGFLLLSLVLAGVAMASRANARKRVASERQRARAARSQQPSMLANPALLATGLQVARAVGFKRIVPLVALAGLALGYFATRETDDDSAEGDET